MLRLFIATIFLGAALLFLVQPMIAKMVLPLFGGSPAVWNTCMVFFQALLLAGYAYAHYSTHWLPTRRQILVHIVLASTPLILWTLGLPPISEPDSASVHTTVPVMRLLLLLLISIGPAFFILSTCGTLTQRWFASTRHAAAKDPYFLYAASNAGSMLALVAYPLLIEPWITLGSQRLAWSIAYGLFFIATIACGIIARRNGATHAAQVSAAPPPTWRERTRWTALAAVPCSLMLAITQYISTDIAAIPLLWIIPLAIYLLTFILAFARRQIIPLQIADRALPILALALAVIMLLARHDPIWIIIVLNLATLFIGALLCHSRLAASRPDPAQLTTFYLCIALGGVLGGAFNALLAPVLFNTLLEYPIIIAAACGLRPSKPRHDPRWLRWYTDAGFALIPVILASLPSIVIPILRRAEIISGPVNDTVRMVLYVGIPVLTCYAFVMVPRRFALAFAALVLLDSAITSRYAAANVRTFFGVYTVQHDATPEGRGMTELLHGTTLHGAQWTDPAARTEPLIYYHRNGPIGDVFRLYNDKPLFDRVALVGLGVGTLASYGRPDQTLTFFEIDPAVVRLSRDSGLFHYLSDSKARCDVTLGDARLSLAKEPNGQFGAIVLDAFSSDAIPVHLMTREAIAMYASKLRPGGLLIFHVSNRYLELERVISGITRDLGLAAAYRNDDVPESQSAVQLYWSSTWVAAARSREDLAPLLKFPSWHYFQPEPRDRVWTDDYSSFIGIFEWSGSQ